MNFFQKLSNAGITSQTPFDQRTRLKGSNMGSLLGIGLLTASLTLAYDSQALIWHFLTLIALLSTSIALNSIGYIRFSYYFIMTAVYIWLIVASIAFGSGMGFDNYFYVAIVCLLMLETMEKWRIVNTCLVISTLVFVKLYSKSHVPIYPLPSLIDAFYMINLVAPCLIIAFVCWNIMKDIRNYQTGILEGKQALKYSNELKDKLLTVIGHDLRTPLSNLNSMLFLLKNKHLSEAEQVEIINNLDHKLEQASHMLDNLLTWASKSFFRSISKQISTANLFDIAQLTNQVMIFFQDEAAKKKVKLSNSIAPGTFVVADQDQILFVLRNLIGNALKFSHFDGTAYIIIGSKSYPDYLEIYISDNGTGIKSHRLPHLFQLENRFSEAGTLKEKGSGFGLIFCKEFIETNGGELRVESEYGKGTKFSFTLNSVSE